MESLLLRRVSALVLVGIALWMWAVLLSGAFTFHPETYTQSRESYAQMAHMIGQSPMYWIGWVVYIGIWLSPALYLIPVYFLLPLHRKG